MQLQLPLVPITLEAVMTTSKPISATSYHHGTIPISSSSSSFTNVGVIVAPIIVIILLAVVRSSSVVGSVHLV